MLLGGGCEWLPYDGGMVKKRKQPEGRAYLRKTKAPLPVLTIHKIRRWREFLDWSQEKLADKSGVGHKSIAAYEGGKEAPTPKLKMIADAMHITPGVLLDVDPFENPHLWQHIIQAASKHAQ